MTRRDARKVKAARVPARRRERGTGPAPQYNIRETREIIGKLIDQVVESGEAVLLGRRDAPDAILVSFERFEPLLRNDLRARLAFLLVDALFGDAPMHLRKPQLDELAGLPRQDLLTLLTIEELPLSGPQQAALERRLQKPEALRRLCRRFEIARTIRDASREGLYDVSEHLADEAVTDVHERATYGKRRASGK